MTRAEFAVSTAIVILAGGGTIVTAYKVGQLSGHEDARAVAAVEAAHVKAAASASASTSGAPSAYPIPPMAAKIVLPASPDDVPTWANQSGVPRDPDGEVCRSINTTCGGFYDQSRCKKGPKSWTTLLTPGQVNCVVAAQGLLNDLDRVRWIQNCAPTINCQVPR